MLDALYIDSELSWLNIRIMSVVHTKDLSVGHLDTYHLTNKVNDVNVFFKLVELFTYFWRVGNRAYLSCQ